MASLSQESRAKQNKFGQHHQIHAADNHTICNLHDNDVIPHLHDFLNMVSDHCTPIFLQLFNQHHFQVHCSALVHGTAVTFQWTFLCCQFQLWICKVHSIFAPRCCMCVNIWFDRFAVTSAGYIVLRCYISQSHYILFCASAPNLQQHLVLPFHCIASMIWPFSHPPINFGDSFATGRSHTVNGKFAINRIANWIFDLKFWILHPI